MRPKFCRRPKVQCEEWKYVLAHSEGEFQRKPSQNKQGKTEVFPEVSLQGRRHAGQRTFVPYTEDFFAKKARVSQERRSFRHNLVLRTLLEVVTVGEERVKTHSRTNNQGKIQRASYPVDLLQQDLRGQILVIGVTLNSMQNDFASLV